VQTTALSVNEVVEAYTKICAWLTTDEAATLDEIERAVIRDGCDDVVLAEPGWWLSQTSAAALIAELAGRDRISSPTRAMLSVMIGRLRPLREDS
jgi:hypothetical protein